MRFPRINKLDVIGVGLSGETALAKLASLPEAYQGVYMTDLNTMSRKERNILIKGLNKLQKPIFAMTGRIDVENGALASLVSDDVDLSRAPIVANAIVQSLNGKSLEGMPIHYNVNHTLTVNMATSHALGLSPPWAVLSEAEIIGGSGSGYLSPSQMADAESLDEMGLSLAEAIKAASFNPGLLHYSQNCREKGHEYIQARAAYLPQLNAAIDGRWIDADRAQQSFQLNPEHLVNGGLRLSQTIWSADDKNAMDLRQTENQYYPLIWKHCVLSLVLMLQYLTWLLFMHDP